MAAVPVLPVARRRNTENRMVSRILSTLRAHTHSTIITLSTRTVHDHEAAQTALHGATISIYNWPAENYPRHHQHCFALAKKTQTLSVGTSRPNKLAVITSLNNIVPETGYFHDHAPRTEAEAELARLACERDYRVIGITMLEVSGDLLKNTGPKGSLSMNPIIVSGSATVQSFSYSRKVLTPGTHGRVRFPKLAPKSLNFGKDGPPVKYKACPDGIFPEIQEVEEGNQEDGCEIIDDTLSFIYDNSMRTTMHTHRDKKNVIPPQLTALTQLLFDSPVGSILRRALAQCRDLIETGNKYFPVYHPTRTLFVRMDQNVQVVGTIDQTNRLPLNGTDRFSLHFLTDGQAPVDTNELVEAYPELWRRFFTDTVCCGDVAIYKQEQNGPSQKNAQNTSVFQPVFNQANYSRWGQASKSETEKTMLYVDAIYMLLLLLQTIEKENPKVNNNPYLLGIMKESGVVETLDRIEMRKFIDWAGSIVSNVGIVSAEMNSKTIVKILDDNFDGSVYVASGKHH